MNRNILILIVIGVLVIAFLLLTVMNTDEQPPVDEGNGQEEVVDLSDVTVTDLMVNGENGTVMLTTDDPSVITATITNESEQEVELTLTVKMDGDLFDNRHDWTYTVAPGETKEVEEVRDDHRTWYPGEFTVELGDEVVSVIVE